MPGLSCRVLTRTALQDIVNAESVFRYAGSSWFSQALQMLCASGVRGLAIGGW